MNVSDRGNEGIMVLYSEDMDISKFILAPSQNDPLTEAVNLKIASVRMQLQMHDDILTARGAEDDEKMAKYCRLYRKLMSVHVKPLQTAAPPPPQNHASLSSTSTSDHFLEFTIHQTPISSYHLSQTKPTFPHKSPPSPDLTKFLSTTLIAKQHLTLIPLHKDPTTTISHPTTTSSIPIPSIAIPQPSSIPTSFPTQQTILTISPSPSCLPNSTSHPKLVKLKSQTTKSNPQAKRPQLSAFKIKEPSQRLIVPSDSSSSK